MKFYDKLKKHGTPWYTSLVHDLLVAGGSFFLAYVTATGFQDTVELSGIVDKIAGFLLVFLFSVLAFSMHKGSWRFVSIPDLLTIIKVSVASVIAYTVAAFLFSRGQNVPRSVPLLTCMYLIAGLSAPRLAYRILMEQGPLGALSNTNESETKYVLLCGLTASAESFIRYVRRDLTSGIAVAGIIDDTKMNRSRIVQGVKVLGFLDDLTTIVSDLSRRGIRVSELIVAEIEPGRQRLGHILERGNAAGIKVSRLSDLTGTSVLTSNSLLEPKPIELGDLLGRPEVKADMESVAGLIEGKVALITGAGGSIGSELCRQIASFSPRKLVITDSSEFHLYLLDTELRESQRKLEIVTRIVNVRDKPRVSQIFEEVRPDVVFHAAALKHVPLVEDNPLEAIKTNLFGTRNVANAALEADCMAFVMISTDKAVNPTNVMGATKRAAEAFCQALDVASNKTRFKTVRFGNVLGSNGSVVPRFREQITAGGPITVTHPQIVRYFMTIPEAVRLVLHASAKGLRRKGEERGKIMVLDMGKPVRIIDLAERMIQLAGFRPRVDIDIVFTGLRPGEKLYEELFDPSEVQDGRTEEGFVVASPRLIDKAVLGKSILELENAVAKEDSQRALELLSHIVPEYQKELTDNEASASNAPITSQPN